MDKSWKLQHKVLPWEWKTRVNVGQSSSVPLGPLQACAAPLPSASYPARAAALGRVNRQQGLSLLHYLPLVRPCCFAAAAAASPAPQIPARATFRRRPATNLCFGSSSTILYGLENRSPFRPGSTRKNVHHTVASYPG
ncbi:hypothetical protein BRADI_4g04921v3 [Brachypodium distachyon]|uniref:Uncharacterized protein n=1 Tax=Brachypodium distachyon TaxID=15368 RepID=A0A2K2CKJ9_BRADI|nr:hypothetical protein BRADI_4g04921v3 [Brachypodium distachyon]